MTFLLDKKKLKEEDSAESKKNSLVHSTSNTGMASFRSEHDKNQNQNQNQNEASSAPPPMDPSKDVEKSSEDQLRPLSNLTNEEVSQCTQELTDVESHDRETIAQTFLEMARKKGWKVEQDQLDDIVGTFAVDSPNCSRTSSYSSANPKEQIQMAFEVLDMNGDGKIDMDDLQQMFEGDKAVTRAHIEALLQTFDKNNDGFIDFQEFAEGITFEDVEE
ncbi:hypothetical protein RFI_08002 [Reticulomyxa filosa]|uniref:EF-hand domain-containing protein n=1 Tax=Reticulomyxa filosa TaxID=46433 RepID=X6NS66_RETFI|nr:hypothetical protein RFI_08002 [Reticulomyxa filosa]|eukprot:ETO29125.1 hypothetical protein RFI_08002 [Reticulomyxa filosa]